MRTLWTLLVLMAVSGFARSETIEWTFPVEGQASAPTLYPDADHPTGVAVTTGSSVILLDGKGAQVWKTVLPSPSATPATAADIDGDGAVELLVALGDGTVVCLDCLGAIRWSHSFNTPAGGFKTVGVADLTADSGLEILAGFDDGWLNCLNARGELVWRFYGDRFRVGGFAIGCVDGDGAPEIVFGTDNGHIYCLDSYGRAQWRYGELAPYGRSGPNLADLDGDGKVEVLITRSNVGNATCLMALDGSTGKFLWRTQDVMQSYVSIATGDFDGDGKLEVLHGDKGNNLYCDNADGSRRWKTELGGRGLFWAPAVADLDGDGKLDILACMRGQEAETKATAFVVSADGSIKQRLALGVETNATPVIADIDGDGQLEAVICSSNPFQIQSLTWNASGKIAWASLRGDSRMSARSGVLAGVAPTSAPEFIDNNQGASDLTLEHDAPVLGDDEWSVSWKTPAPENAYLEVLVNAAEGGDADRVVDLKAGTTSEKVPVSLVSSKPAKVSVRLHVPDASATTLYASCEVTPQAPDYCGFDSVAESCNKAADAARAAGADPAPVLTRLSLLRSEQDVTRERVSASAPADELAQRANTLRANAAALDSLARALGDFWAKGGSGNFVCWRDPNPWDPFNPEEVPTSVETDVPVSIHVFSGELEDVAITLRNISSTPFDVHCAFIDPRLKQPRAKEPELAKIVKLSRLAPVGTALSDRAFDVLPELDASRAISLPTEEARQLWLTIDARGLAAGTHEVTLFLGSMTKPSTFRAVPLRIEVWPVDLPDSVFAKNNWVGLNVGETSDQARKDLIDHHVSVVYGPASPPVPVDASGHRADPVDWAAFDRDLERIPTTFTLLMGGPQCKWPNGAAPSEDSPEYAEGFKSSLKELAEHLASKGFPRYQWAFYPIDEPWNTGFTAIPSLRRFCKLVKNSDPTAQVYADPAGLVRVEYLEEFKDLIDIWQPEMNLLKRDPALLEWFHKNAHRFWAYEAPGPSKDLLPLGHYRAFSWYALKFGLEGAGYWVYRGDDNWWGWADTDYSSIYPSGDLVVPSRRWNADRDGVEDYRAVHVLRDEIAKARAAGRVAEADKAEALINEAIEKIVGWQIGSIDEITRWTRDYEVDLNVFDEYKERIAREILALREAK